jgi:hypothetical protein
MLAESASSMVTEPVIVGALGDASPTRFSYTIQSNSERSKSKQDVDMITRLQIHLNIGFNLPQKLHFS